jgi:molybdopterin molybdotransferase
VPEPRPTAAVARRSRALADPHTGLPSRFRLVTCEEAWRRLLRVRPVGTELVRVEEATGRVLATDLRAPLDVPHFARSYMDGYAVRARDTAGATAARPVRLRVAGSVEMGAAARRRLGRGEAVRIPTGGMLPPGADAVVMVEHTAEPGGGVVEIGREAAPGQHVMRRGEDVRRGRVVFRRGHRFRPRDVGALSGVGRTRVRVHRLPRVALIATGDEIVPPHVTPRPGQVRNVNQYALRALIAAEGGVPLDLGVLPDRRGRLARAFARALAEADAVLFSGGSSVGAKDLTPEVVRAAPRARILVHGIRVKPGKPTLIAEAAGKPVLGLPGNPTSALVIFALFGVPLLRRLGGEPTARALRPRRRAGARLAVPVASQPGRDDWVRVALEETEDGIPLARPVPGGSGDIFSLVRADGLVRVPRAAAGLPAGTLVEVRLLS